jgi:shikimate dehydrogenase
LPNTAPTFAQLEGRFLTGLIGRDILASRSPWLHEQEADALGLRLVYALQDFAAKGWDETDLPRVLDAAQSLGFSGLNVTHPYKQVVIAHLDELSEGARRVGAVNTVQFSGVRKIGYNTDVIGFAKSFEDGLPGAAKASVVQIGAGGAGFATSHALLDLGVEHLHVFDNDAARRAALVEKLNLSFGAGRALEGSDLSERLARCDGIVNATPVGMAAYPGMPVPADALRPEMWLADIVYFPLETQLLAEARARGCRTLNGSGMAVYQAAAAFDIFTGATADPARMLESFRKFVSKDSGDAP